MLHLMSCCHRSRTTFHERQSDFAPWTFTCCFWICPQSYRSLLGKSFCWSVNPFTAMGRIYTSQKRPSGWWPRTYIYVQPQFRFFAFVTARPLTWRLLHASEVSSSSVICLSSVRSGENLHTAKHKSVRRLFRSPNWFVLCDLQVLSW